MPNDLSIDEFDALLSSQSRKRLPTIDDLKRAAAAKGINPEFAAALVSQESGGNWNTKPSPAGARGGMQVMPGTFRAMMGDQGNQDDPWDNMEAGLRYIDYGRRKLGTDDPVLLAAGYHQGYDRPELRAGKIADTNDGLISTRNYARAVAAKAGIRLDNEPDKNPSQRMLESWEAEGLKISGALDSDTPVPKSAPAGPGAPKASGAEDRGFVGRNAGYLKDNLKISWNSLANWYDGWMASQYGELLNATEGAPLQDRIGTQAEYDRYMASIAKRQKENEEIQKRGRPETQQFFQASEGKGFLEQASMLGDALMKNPVGVITDIGTQSLLPSLAIAATALAARFGFGGTTPAVAAGGAGSMGIEFGNDYADLRLKGESHEKAWQQASIKAGVVGLLDAASMASAGKALDKVLESGLKGRLKEVGKEVGRQAALGAAGEGLGTLASGRTPDLASVTAEAIGEVFSAPGEALSTFRGQPRQRPAGTAPADALPADEVLDAPDRTLAAPTEAGKTALLTPAAPGALDRVNAIDERLAKLAALRGTDDATAQALTGKSLQEVATEWSALQAERARLTANWPAMRTGAATTFQTETGADLQGQYALVDADALVASHDLNLRPNPAFPQELQPRDRERAASEVQISGMVQRLNPARLGESPDVANGAPIVGADGVVESGNARTIALQRMYQANGQTAQQYRQWLTENALRFGVSPEDVAALTKPVLVRVRSTPVNRAEFARQANAPTTAMMSPSEQARADAARLQGLDGLEPNEFGDFSGAQNQGFIRRFVGALPRTEQAGMIDADGQLSQAGYARMRNAILARAYGDSPVLLRMVESMDNNLRNITSAMMRTAPRVAKARDAIAAGGMFDADLTQELMAAVEELSRLRADGQSVAGFLAQAGVFGDRLSPEATEVLMFLDENIRSPKKIADFILAYLDVLEASGDPRQGDMLGGVPAPTRAGVLRAAKERTSEQDAAGVPEGPASGAATLPAGPAGGIGTGQAQGARPDRTDAPPGGQPGRPPRTGRRPGEGQVTPAPTPTPTPSPEGVGASGGQNAAPEAPATPPNAPAAAPETKPADAPSAQTPAPGAPAAPPAQGAADVDEELQQALGELGAALSDIFGNKANVVPGQYTAADLLPLLSKVVFLIVRRGAKRFRAAVLRSMEVMRANEATARFVDNIQPRQWRAAYNAIAEDIEGTDSEEVVAQLGAAEFEKLRARSAIVERLPAPDGMEAVVFSTPDGFGAAMLDTEADEYVDGSVRRFTGEGAREQARAAAEEMVRKATPKGETPPAPAPTPAPAPAQTRPSLSTPTGRQAVAQAIADRLIGGEGFAAIVDARRFIAQLTGEPIEPGTQMAKLADETIEVAVVRAAREMVTAGRRQNRSDAVIYDRLVGLYQLQPTLGMRTSTSVREQAYSTPVPLAFVASRLAGVTETTRVGEPTAGNTMLLLEVAPQNAVVNELNDQRAQNARALGFTVTQNNAATTALAPAKTLDRVLANPPFGVTRDERGEPVEFAVAPDYATREIDHAISLQALEALRDDGRAVLILGGVNATSEEALREGYRGKAKREFYARLYAQYKVVDHFSVDGRLYAKQGAAYPVDVIVIEGRGRSARPLPAAQLPQRVDSWDALKEKLNDAGQANAGVGAPGNVGGADGGGGAQGNEAQGGAVVGGPGGAGDAAGAGGRRPQGGNAGGGAGAGDAGGRRPAGGGAVPGGGQLGTEGGAGAQGAGNTGSVSGDGAGGNTGSAPGVRGDGSVAVGGDGGGRTQPAQSGLKDRRGQEQETATQVAYAPKSGAPSVGTLVPVAMRDAIQASLRKVEAAVGPVDAFVAKELGFRPEELGTYFSAEQVDALALSIFNAQKGAGFIIGDQTGIGKGRVVAGMIRYALRNGRIPVFVTEKPNLYADMIRDLDDIGMAQELGLESDRPAVLITNGGEPVPYALIRREGGEVVEIERRLKAPRSGQALETMFRDMAATGDLGPYRVVFTTYSQMQEVNKKVTERMKFVQAIAERAYMIFDESHNAGGTSATQARSREQRDNQKEGIAASGRAAFVRRLVRAAAATFFSSATYAKRPDVMDLYSSTNMMLAVDRPEQLGAAIQAGGVPMQQIVATMLTEDGQYIRRERTFAGVSYDTRESAVDKATAENMATAMRRILEFSREKEKAVKALRQELDAEGAIAMVEGESTQVQGANFGSIMHNLIDQMLLSLKAQQAVDFAIERMRAGEKVVLTVSNTMGSFLKDYADEMGINPGEPVALSFADLYLRYLEKQRIVTVKRPGSKVGEKVRLTDAQLGPRLTKMFNDVRQFIEGAGFGQAPMSPIDYMHDRLRKAGFKTDEITGRQMTLSYASGTPTLSSRKADIRQRLKAIRGFNGGEIDALILNQSGSTGLSLHASEKFKDQRKRRMIIVQAEKNIDTHMQMLGRVHRTGQVSVGPLDPARSGSIAARARALRAANRRVDAAAGSRGATKAEAARDAMLTRFMMQARSESDRDVTGTAGTYQGRPALYGFPAYTQMLADIPAEMRPAAVLLKKMASLNANTTANRKSAVTAEGVVDFMNDYGGQVAVEFLTENPEVHRALGGSKVLEIPEDVTQAGEEIIRKFTGYIPILPIEQQEAIYQDLIERYNELLARENAMGTNKLEAKALDLKAKTLESNRLTGEKKGGSEDSRFSDDAYMELVEVARTVKPMTRAEVDAAMADGLKGVSPPEHALALAKKLRADMAEYLQRRQADLKAAEADPVRMQRELDTARMQRDTVMTALETYWVGTPVMLVDSNSNATMAMVTSFTTTGSTKNPAAGSAWKVTLALVNGEARALTLSVSQLGRGLDMTVQNKPIMVVDPNTNEMVMKTIPEMFDLYSGSGNVRREKRWMVTGNILAGFARYPGQIITYTKDDGTLEQGVLMRRGFDYAKAKESEPAVFPDAQKILEFFDAAGAGATVGTRDGVLVVRRSRGGLDEYDVETPASKRQGGQFFLDRKLTQALGGDFAKAGGVMRARVDRAAVRRALQYLRNEAGVSLQAMTHGKVARQVLGLDGGAQGENNLRVEQPRARYGAPGVAQAALYEEDLFGNPVPDSAGKAGNPRSNRARVPRVVDATTAIPLRTIDDALPGSYAITTAVVEERREALPVTRITTEEEAAQAFAYLNRNAVERMDALITDRNGNPLAVVGGFKGALAEATWVPDTMLKEAFRIRGAANLWLGHNHPSGTARLSDADVMSGRALHSMLRGSGISMRGILAVVPTEGGVRFGFTGYNETTSQPSDASLRSNASVRMGANVVTVPVVNRVFTRNEKLRPAPLSSPIDAKNLVPALSQGRPGMLLMDVQYTPTAFVALDPAGLEQLRGKGGRMDALFRTLSMANAGAAMVANPNAVVSDMAIANLGAFLRANNVRLLDAISFRWDARPGAGSAASEVRSHSEQGKTIVGDVFLSRERRTPSQANAQTSPAPAGLSVSDVRAALAPVLRRAKNLPARGVRVVRSVSDLPVDLQSRVMDMGAQEQVEGVYDEVSGAVWIVADHVPTALRAEQVLFHELFGHFGLRGLLGADMDAALRDLAARNANVRKRVAQLRADYGYNEAQANEEAVVEFAERGVRLEGLRRLGAAIQQGLRRLGMERMANWMESLTNAEVMTVLAEARRFVREGTTVGGWRGAEMLLSAKAKRWYSQLARSVAQAKAEAMPGKQWAAWLNANAAKLGVKAEEIQWSGVNDWLDMQQGKVSKEALLGYLREGGVRVEETTLSGWTPRQDDTDFDTGRYEGYDEAKYGKYTLPGGTNYREVLLTLPDVADRPKSARHVALQSKMDSGGLSAQELAELDALRDKEGSMDDRRGFKSTHWDQPNVLAHIRVNDRVDADGKRVLFVEEIQSDWGQEGKKKGFVSEGKMPEGWKTFKDERNGWYVIDNNNTQVGLYAPTEAEAIASATTRKGFTGGVPSAPFITKTEGWLNLALKRVMTMAVEGNYDRVAFVNGEQSAERYDLSKQVESIQWAKGPRGYSISAFQGGSEVTRKDGLSESELEDVVGKEIAQKIVGGVGTEAMRDTPREMMFGVGNVGLLRGLDLKVGGEGMRAFYDQIVPQALKKLLPKVGGGQMGAVAIQEWHDGRDEFGARLMDPGPMDGATLQQPGFDVTPAMRQTASGGLPLFSRAASRAFATRTPQVMEALAQLRAGKLTAAEYDAIVATYRPVRPYTSVPRPATRQEMVDALDAGKRETVGAPSRLLKDGHEVGLRLDIPAYDRHGVWVPTIHERGAKAGGAGKKIGHESTAIVNNARFSVHEGAAEAIASGNPKGTIATVEGRWENASPEDAVLEAEAALRDPAWTQVGMDPFRHSFFYDRRDMRPVVSADRVIQVGPLVLAKNVVYGNRGDVLFSRKRSPSAARGDAQQAQTDTPEFKRWFGDSKVVDENGKPMIMYHGTENGGFTVFNRMKSTEWRQPSMDTVGSWFSNNPSESDGAGLYGRFVMPVYLSIQNPKKYRTFSAFLRHMHRAAGRPMPDSAPGRGSTEELRAELKEEGYDGIEFEQTANESLMQDILDMQDAVQRAKQEEFSVPRRDRLPYTQKRERLEQTLNSMRKEIDEFGSSTEFDGQRVFIAFEPEQIKSAIGNVGTWDRRQPDIMLSRGRDPNAQPPTPQEQADEILSKRRARFTPLETLTRMAVRATFVDRLTGAAYDRLLRMLNQITPERVKAGLVSDYGLPEAVVDRRIAMQGTVKTGIRQVGEIVAALGNLTRAESRVAYQWMNADDPQSSDYFLEQLPAESVRVLADVEKWIDKMSDEAVKLGLLSPESRERHRYAYLRRSYLKHEEDATPQQRTNRRRAIAVLGDQYKGRGIVDGVEMNRIEAAAPTWWQRKLEGQKADKALKGQEFLRLERLSGRAQATAPLEGMEPGQQRRRVLEVVYWPAAEPVPAKYAGWDYAGRWEVRDVRGSQAIMWRDFTAQERERMGEIDEVKYAVARTLHGMLRDIETARYLKWVADTYSRPTDAGLNVVEASETLRSSFRADEWVRVPDTVIPKTGGLRRYGALAGRYVPGPIWNDIRQSAGPTSLPLGEIYNEVLRAWKISKTALSPAVHTNNIMANVVMADWHDVRAAHMAKALEILVRSQTPAHKNILNRFEDAGGGIGTWSLSELQREQLEPLLAQLKRDVAQNSEGLVGAAAALQLALSGRWREAISAASMSKGAVVTQRLAKAMIDLYQAEDVVFRLAAFIKAKEEGADDLAAAKLARKSFLDYQINAPWIQMMRQTAFPFIAFTYRAAPMLLETAAKRPWKLAKIGLVLGGLNALGYALSGGDEDKERKLLPEEKAGKIFGVVAPKLIRMPWNDENDSPVFLDVRRWIPVGDIFDLEQTHAAVPIMPLAVPGGPLAVFAELVFNRSQFTGKPITKDTDTGVLKAIAEMDLDRVGVEQEAKVLDHLYKTFAPNIGVVPGTYAFEAITKAAGGRTDAFGREQSAGMAVASALGVKVGAYPRDVLLLNETRKRDAQVREIRENMTALKRELARKGISADEFAEKQDRQMEKLRRINERFAEKVAP